MEGDEAFQRPASVGGENPLVEIGDKLCPEDDNSAICSGHGTCKLGMSYCVMMSKTYYKVINIVKYCQRLNACIHIGEIMFRPYFE